MECEEKNRLCLEFYAAVQALHESALKVARLHGAERRQAIAESEPIKQACHRTKQAFLSHREEHGC
jgi:hypothetical protein